MNPETREPSFWASASVAHCPQVALGEISEAILWQGNLFKEGNACELCGVSGVLRNRTGLPSQLPIQQPHSGGEQLAMIQEGICITKVNKSYTYWTPLQPHRNLAVKHWPTHPCATLLAARKWCPGWEGEPKGFSLPLLHRSYGTPSPKLSFPRTHQLETVSFRADFSPLSKCVVLRCIEVITDNILVKTTMVLNIREQ